MRNDLIRQAEQNLTNEERLALWKQRMEAYRDKELAEHLESWWFEQDKDEEWIKEKGED